MPARPPASEATPLRRSISAVGCDPVFKKFTMLQYPGFHGISDRSNVVRVKNFADAARMRQANFQEASPTISEQGRRPSDNQGQRHGHLLALGYGDGNLYPSLRGEPGVRRFFKERGIKWHRTTRSGDSPGTDGPTRNVTSSRVRQFPPVSRRDFRRDSGHGPCEAI